MSYVLVLDPQTGMAGDMFIAALVSLGIDVADAIRKLNEIADIAVRYESDGVIIDTKPRIHDARHDLILSLTEKYANILNLKENFKEMALQIVKILINAEKKVHEIFRIGHGDRLHEAADVIVDALLSAFALQKLNIREVYCLSPVYIGGGIVRFSHGVFDVPAPATRFIINEYNIPVEKGPVNEELLTPTGAAILAALNPVYIPRRDYRKNFEEIKRGQGLGHKKIGIPNVLKVYLAKKRENIFREKIVQLETNLDDISPEILATIFNELPKALDIQIVEGIGKKNRPTFIVKIWCYPEDEETIVKKLFKVTGTLGIRRYEVERYVKPRWVCLKKVRIGDKTFVIRFKGNKPEFSDLLNISKKTGLSVLEIQRKILSGEIKVIE